MPDHPIIERAFYLARLGTICTFTDVKQRLIQEGYRERDILMYVGGQKAQRELREAMRAAGCPGRGKQSERLK